ncbi:MAG: protein-L-isoaspartate(D-aspartate) O-methyltransferase [Gammaproteobacteria bacterium]|jgi:protein-L-isoaspartate(D-aspartate) O-methyltransferase
MLNHQGIGMTSRRTKERLIDRLKSEGISNLEVLNVIREIPRHLFVDEALASRAYEDTALPIGYGQTISQPYIVARMTELLIEHEPAVKYVLEVGTGSGYQTAILSRLVTRVFSVERIEGLHQQAKKLLRELQIRNIKLKYTDGGMGMPEYAPYDGIIVTAAPEGIPLSLVNQLKPGGIMVMPVGTRDEQVLIKIIKTDEGYEKEFIERVSFVPLLGGVT